MTPIGHKKVYLEETDSTNYQVYLLSRSTRLEEGFLLYTGFQHKGQARSHLGWFSSPDANILMSFFLRPESFMASRAFEISIMVSLGIVRFLDDYGIPDCYIKWPNDIFVKGKKIAGILINNLTQGEKLISSIVGIGLNVNETNFPPFDYQATSLALEKGRKFDVTEVMDKLIAALNQSYQEVYTVEPFQRKLEYNSWLMGMGCICIFGFPDGKEQSGILLGIDEYGRILVEFDGKVQAFQMGEIRQKATLS